MGSDHPRLRLTIRAHPGARREAVELLPDESVAVWVRARAVDGKANDAIERTLADWLGVPRSQVQLVRGHANRQKLVEVALSAEEVKSRLVARAVRAVRA